jgi:SDR family mycofactocin-dependent oxidoreductase
VAGRVAGKVAFITGAARGQGRSHAVRLAEEGADIIAVDICRDYDTVSYPLATEADLDDTVKAVEALDRRIVAATADVRDMAALKSVVDDGVAELGRLDIVCANAGICTVQTWDEVTPAVWQDTLDTNLTGVWNTMVVSAPHLIAGGGGSIICTSSTAGIKGLPYLAPYVAAKHGVVGIARTMANELASHNIRVNTVHPTGVSTPMADGLGGLEGLIGRDPNLGPIYMNTLPIESLDAREISNAVLFLASDESRYVTGLEFTVDAGNTIRLRGDHPRGRQGQDRGQRRWARVRADPGRAGRQLAVIRGYRDIAPAASGLFA